MIAPRFDSLQPGAASVVAADKRRRTKRRRRLLISAVVLVGAVAFGFFGLPPIVKAQAIKRLSAELHRDVSIERIQINPFTLSITIENLAIKDRDGAAFTSWKRLFVNFDSFSLFTGEWRFQEIALDGFSQRVAIAKDGTFNFADLIPKSDPAAPKPPADKSAKPPRPLRIEKLAVTSAAVDFSDASRPQPFATQAGPLTFTLTNFLTAGDPKAPYEFTAVTEAGETFSWRGTVSVDPVRSAGEFKIGGISLKKYAPYYADRISADLLDGAIDLSAKYLVDLSKETHALTMTDGAFRLYKLKVAPRGSDTAVIDLPSFRIEGVNADGLKQTATIQLIALDGGALNVRREKDGSINLLNLLQPPANAVAASASAAPVSAPPVSVGLPNNSASAISATPAASASTASPASTSPALPDVKLGEFSITGVAIDFEDLTTPTPAKNSIERFSVSVKDIALTDVAKPIAFAVSAGIKPGGALELTGSVVREPLSIELAISAEALPLANITPYVEPMLNLRIAGGSVSVHGKARSAGADAGFEGDVVVDKFATVDGVQGEDFVKFTALAIKGIKTGSQPLAAQIESILLTDPSARIVVNADKTTNLAKILRTPTAPVETAPPDVTVKLPATIDSAAKTTSISSSASAATAAAGPEWSLGKFTLSNGSVAFADRSTKPAVRASLDNFSGTIAGLSSAAPQRADIDIHGKFNGGGAINITGKLDARALTPTPGAVTEIVVDVKNVDLSPISPYVGTYAGYQLARSGLSIDVKTRLTERKIDSNNVVTLKQFTFGAATNSPEATKLPVRLGVALLKDINGNIVIDIPVNDSIDNPNFRIGRVVLRVITNLLVKAATSPFSLIGSAFGGGGDELAWQEFNPGKTEPVPTEIKKLHTLKQALKGRPALNLNVTGSFDAEVDGTVLREQALDKKIRFRLWEELRIKNPDTPPPAGIEVTPADAERIVGLMIAESVPQYTTLVRTGVVSGPPVQKPAAKSVAQQQQQRVSTTVDTRRYSRVSGGRSMSVTRPAAPKVEPVKPVIFAPAVPAAVSESNTVSTGPGASTNTDDSPANANADTSANATPNSGTAAAPAMTLEEARAQLLAGITISDDDLRQLAADRASQVRDSLLSGNEIDAGRILISAPADGKGARVLLELR